MKLRPRAKGLSRIVSLQLWGMRGGSPFFAAVAASLLVLSTFNPSALQSVRMSALDAVSPVLGAVNAPFQAAAGYVRAVTGLAALQEENARLHKENARLREWYQIAQSLQTENKSLRDLLNIVPEAAPRYVTARVIADSGSPFVKSLLVLAGAGQSVEKGQAVLGSEGVIGRVIETGSNVSRILLLNDINSRIPVQIEGTEYKAIMGGRNADMPVLEHLPPDTKIEEGSRVVTSGHGGLFPFGLPVGVVMQGPEGEVAVRPYADALRATFVRILDKPGDPNLIKAKP